MDLLLCNYKEYLKNIDGKYTFYQNKVDNTHISNPKKDLHKTRMIKDYLFPLLYLIYSYIYQKFYILQQRKYIIMENDFNYKMYKYFFSHKNPIVKKVNIYLYKLYKPVLLSNEEIKYNELNFNSNGDVIYPENISKYIIPEIRKGKTRNELINLLNEINNKFNENNNVIIDDTHKDLKNLIKKTKEILEMFKTIQENFDESYTNTFDKHKEINNEIRRRSPNDQYIINIPNEVEFNERINNFISENVEIIGFNNEKKTLKEQLSNLENEKIEKERKKRNHIKNLTSKVSRYNENIRSLEKHIDNIKKKKENRKNSKTLHTIDEKITECSKNIEILKKEIENLKNKIMKNNHELEKLKKNHSFNDKEDNFNKEMKNFKLICDKFAKERKKYEDIKIDIENKVKKHEEDLEKTYNTIKEKLIQKLVKKKSDINNSNPENIVNLFFTNYIYNKEIIISELLKSKIINISDIDRVEIRYYKDTIKILNDLVKKIKQYKSDLIVIEDNFTPKIEDYHNEEEKFNRIKENFEIVEKAFQSDKDVKNLLIIKTDLSDKLEKTKKDLQDKERELKDLESANKELKNYEKTLMSKKKNKIEHTKEYINKSASNINNEIKEIIIKISYKKKEIIENENKHKKKLKELKELRKVIIKYRTDKNKYTIDLVKIEKQKKEIDKIFSTIGDKTIIYNVINKLKFSNIKDYEIYIKYKDIYINIITKYKSLVNDIDLINKNLLKIFNINDIIHEESFTEEKVNEINTNIENLKKNNKMDDIFEINNEIISYLNKEINLIKTYYNSLFKNNNTYLNEILDNKINNLLSNILSIIEYLLYMNDPTTKKKYNINNTLNSYVPIEFTPNDKKITILIYIYITIYYKELVEYYYLKKINGYESYDSDLKFYSEKIIVMIDTIKKNKKTCNDLLKELKKDKKKLKFLNEQKKKIKDNLNNIKNEIELLKDDKLTNEKYKEKEKLINTNLKSKETSYKTKKEKKNEAKKILDELEIKDGDQIIYKTSALSKIKNNHVRNQIKASIEEFVKTYSKKITNTNETGKQTEKTIQPDNNLVKNTIYNMIKDYYNKNINININNNKKELNKSKKEKYELEFKYNDINEDFEIKTLIAQKYQNLINAIDDEIVKLNSNENTAEIQNLCNDEFNKLILISEKIKNILNNKEYDNTENKIYYHLKNDDIINFILTNGVTEIDYSRNTFSIDKKTASEIIVDTTIRETYLNIIKNYINKKNFTFIEKIKEINIVDNEIKPFFEEYINYFDNILLKINSIIDKINMKIFNFNTKIKIDNYFDEYANEKIKNINNIKEKSVNLKTIKKDKYIEIIPYTDTMFLYIIYLILIIDYLNYFYSDNTAKDI